MRRKGPRLMNSKKKRQRPTLPEKPVPSAQQGLTSLFGMGRGGTPALKSPKTFITRCDYFLKRLVEKMCLEYEKKEA